MRLTLGDDWAGAWEDLPWRRPDDWRAVADELAWDVALLGAGWPHLEAAHQSPDEQRGLIRRLDALRVVVADDLPYLIGVGPTAPAADAQPQLALDVADDPPLESLAERPDDLSWRLYFWMVFERTLDRALDRAAPALRRLALEDRGGVSGDEPFEAALAATFPPGATPLETERWWHRRTAQDRSLGRALGEQVALQVELLLRGQLPTVLPLLEEAVALGVEDAALGGAIHVETLRGRPVALRLVSYEGTPRAPVWLDAEPDADLRTLLRAAGRTVAEPERARAAS